MRVKVVKWNKIDRSRNLQECKGAIDHVEWNNDPGLGAGNLLQEKLTALYGSPGTYEDGLI